MSDISVPVEYLLRSHQCSANCLLALGDSQCTCPCGGRYHGALSNSVVSASDRHIVSWYTRDDVVDLYKDEYVDCRKSIEPLNQLYSNSHGSLETVIRHNDADYEVRFDYPESRFVAAVEKYLDFCEFCDALLLSGRVKQITKNMPTKAKYLTGYAPDKQALERMKRGGMTYQDVQKYREDPSSYGFTFSATGIRSIREATVIHNQTLNLRYGTFLENEPDVFTNRIISLIPSRQRDHALDILISRADKRKATI